MLCPREERERLEHYIVGAYGVLADSSRGRLKDEEECSIRTCFQRDIDRITHSKSFRRLKHKTQVFLQPEGDHYRTRLTHTLDLGHTPFGHAGERALNEIYPGGFKHYEQSLRVVDVLERDGRGLNLCYETRMGILNHTVGAPEDTLEATTVRLCDRIAYVNHDLDDSIRAGILTEEDVPARVRENCGDKNSRRINAFISDLIANSGGGKLKMSDEMQETFNIFHAFMFSDVYTNPVAKSEENKVKGILSGLYTYYTSHPDALPDDFRGVIEHDGIERAACDYISGMTDGYAMEKYGEIFIPFAWTVK